MGYDIIHLSQCQTNCITIEDIFGKVESLDSLMTCVDVLEDFGNLHRRTVVGMQAPMHALNMSSDRISDASKARGASVAIRDVSIRTLAFFSPQ